MEDNEPVSKTRDLRKAVSRIVNFDIFRLPCGVKASSTVEAFD
jgi:hypothetical protein